MSKRLIAWAIAALIASPIASAQGGSYAGVSVGFPLLASGHWGFVDLLGAGTDLRLNFSGALLGSVEGALFAGSLGADVLQRTTPEGGAFTPYVGGGVGAAYLGVTGGGESMGAFAALLNAVAGVEFGVSGLNLFTEIRGTGLIGFGEGGPGFLPVVGLAVGVNFRR